MQISSVVKLFCIGSVHTAQCISWTSDVWLACVHLCCAAKFTNDDNGDDNEWKQEENDRDSLYFRFIVLCHMYEYVNRARILLNRRRYKRIEKAHCMAFENYEELRVHTFLRHAAYISTTCDHISYLAQFDSIFFQKVQYMCAKQSKKKKIYWRKVINRFNRNHLKKFCTKTNFYWNNVNKIDGSEQYESIFSSISI